MELSGQISSGAIRNWLLRLNWHFDCGFYCTYFLMDYAPISPKWFLQFGCWHVYTQCLIKWDPKYFRSRMIQKMKMIQNPQRLRTSLLHYFYCCLFCVLTYYFGLFTIILRANYYSRITCMVLCHESSACVVDLNTCSSCRGER